MCFYCRIQNGEIPLDPQTYELVAPLAQAVRFATNNLPDNHFDAGFDKLRELAVAHDGASVLPFIDAYLAFRADIARRSSIMHDKAAESTATAIEETYVMSYVDKRDVSEDEGAALDNLEKEITDVAATVTRMDPNAMKSLYRRMKSPRAAQVVNLVYEVRELIRQVFNPSC